MVVGFANAVIAFGITESLHSRRWIDPNAPEVWVRVIPWVWPTAIMLMPGDDRRSTATTVMVVGMSVIANMVIYGILGLAIGAVWQKVRAGLGRVD
jgi:hypothetical protein